jgi:cytosine/adenosine deaminase-related metal-dependent hydrolase
MTDPVIRTTAAFVLGHSGGDHRLIPGGEVVHQGSTIIHVGTDWSGPVDETVDCGAAIIMPGFVDLDALADIDHALIDSWSTPDLATGHQWSGDYFRNRRTDVFTAVERAVIREYAVAQLIRHGVTTFMPIASEVHSAWAETYDDMVAMAGVVERLGIRGYLGPSYRAGVNVVEIDEAGRPRPVVLFDDDAGHAGFHDAERFLDYAAGIESDLVHGVLLPCRIETMTPELMRATAALAGRRRVPVRLHCLQGRTELDHVRDRYGLRPVELLEQTGLLNVNLLVPHAVFVGERERVPGGSDRDLDKLAESDVTVVHCPMTSIRYGSVLESFDRYRATGIRIALGTDSFPPDLVRGIDYGNNIAKYVDGNQSAGAIADYVRAATIGGADALGRPDLGRLQVGASADFVVAQLDDFAMGVRDDPVRTLIMNGSGRDISRSVIAGRVVMENKSVVGIDEDALAGQAQHLFTRMRAAYTDRDHASRPCTELFPPSFTTEPTRRSDDQS